MGSRTAQQATPRHFRRIAAPYDIQVIVGDVFVPCDVPPAFWLKDATGNLAPAKGEDLDILKQHMGRPRRQRTPAPTERPNPIREAMRELDEMQQRELAQQRGERPYRY